MSATIRAKFHCSEVNKMAYGQERAKLTAVVADAGIPENSSFAKSTPNGNLDIWIDNPAAQGFLVPGKYYYLDFTEVPQ